MKKTNTVFTPISVINKRPAWMTPDFNPQIADKNYWESVFTPVSVIPKKGGLKATNRPNPYGLRAYPTKTGYGGEMMPKDIGWLGILKGLGEMSGQNVTEFSSEDDLGSYPTVVPTLTQQEIIQVLQGNVTPEIDKKARQFRDWRVKQGLSPFFNTIND